MHKTIFKFFVIASSSLLFASTFHLLFSSEAVADESCDILRAGNIFYNTQKYREAIPVYSNVQRIDPQGKLECTSSVFATLGTIYTILGKTEFNNQNYRLSATSYNLASTFNRRFANAVICYRTGKCDLN